MQRDNLELLDDAFRLLSTNALLTPQNQSDLRENIQFISELNNGLLNLKLDNILNQDNITALLQKSLC